ncbi:nucleotide exchange factor GrpE [Dactylosporangium cerinum]
MVQAAQPACTAREPFGVTAALTGFVGALLVGAALLLLLLLSSRGGPRQVQVPVAARGNGTGPADADRRALVQACIYVRDRVTSKALGDRLGAALAEAGVKTLEPTGVRFDPAHHEAGGAAPATDPKLIGSIAAVEVPGYLDRDGRVLRAPIVTVYQAARNPGGPTGAHPTVQQPAQHTPSPQPRRAAPMTSTENAAPPRTASRSHRAQRRPSANCSRPASTGPSRTCARSTRTRPRTWTPNAAATCNARASSWSVRRNVVRAASRTC